MTHLPRRGHKEGPQLPSLVLALDEARKKSVHSKLPCCSSLTWKIQERREGKKGGESNRQAHRHREKKRWRSQIEHPLTPDIRNWLLNKLSWTFQLHQIQCSKEGRNQPTARIRTLSTPAKWTLSGLTFGYVAGTLVTQKSSLYQSTFRTTKSWEMMLLFPVTKFWL